MLSEISSMYLKPYAAMYFSRIVDIDMKPVDMIQIERDGQRKIVRDTILLELVAQGKLNLYSYIDQNSKRHFFIQKDGGNTQELAYVKYITKNGRLFEMKSYVGELQSVTNDCAQMPKPPSSYSQKLLVKYVTSYNECTGTNIADSKKKQGSKLSPYVGAGIGFGHGTYDGSEIQTFAPSSASNGKYESTVKPLVSAGFDVVSSRLSNRFIPGVQIQFQQTGNTVRHTTGNGKPIYTMNFTMLHFGPSLKYLLTSGNRINPYVRAGLYGTSLLKYETRRESTLSATRQFSDQRSIGYGYSGAVGASLGQLSLEVAYKKTNLPTTHTARATFSDLDVCLYWHFLK